MASSSPQVTDTTTTDPIVSPPFIYLGLYDYIFEDEPDDVDSRKLSWRLIPSQSSSSPQGGHHSFGIHAGESSFVSDDCRYLDDPMEDIRAFIRFPVKEGKTYDDLYDQLEHLSETFLPDAIDHEWEECEWVYNVIENLEILDYMDDNVTQDWHYHPYKPKMDVFREKISNLVEQVQSWNEKPECRVVDFPINTSEIS